MKLKLLKCAICHNWNHSFRNHCANCGAMKFHMPRVVNDTVKLYPSHVDVDTNREIVRCTDNHKAVQGIVISYDLIARELSE